MRFAKVLVANRGEIACRVIRTLKRLGIASVAIYSDADRDARHVALADEAIRVGPAPAADSYLNVAAILAAAHATGAQAVHPGYGFLSEHAGFADACEAAGLRFIGPRGEHMRAFGLKHTARELAAAHGVALLPGTGLLGDVAAALAAADAIGYPVMLKSTAGGGGIGMSLCRDAAQLDAAFDSVVRLGNVNFAHAGVYLEKFVEHARHIEVQIFGDGRGGAIALGERDCSVQRRNQKVIEETPAPDLTAAERDALHASAVRLARAVGYASAGTVEFVFDASARHFYFLEVNTRLQVEHCVTEAVTGIDLVEWMILQAEGDLPPLDALAVAPRGASIQVRLYAEDPNKQFQPSAGLLTHVAFPDDVRVDGWIEAGTEISAHYDPLLAKLIVRGDTRRDALAALQAALARTELYGIETNLDYLRAIAGSDTFAHGAPTTAFLSRFAFAPHTIDVLDGGMQTTVQQAPGRVGYWSVGVPPSGPMDDRAFDLANALLGNPRDAAGLEFTMVGATLRFNTATLFVLGGAPLAATLDGEPAPFWQVLRARPGAVLKLGGVTGAGVRACLAVKGGLQVPDYLGSKATFTLGQFGGHAGRALRRGDVLHLHAVAARGDAGATLPAAEIPALTHAWTLGVLDGPHGAPDFFTPDDIAMLYGTQWTVHYNSSRTGVRLIGPKPQWARADGGEAGLHPSNIHDNAYAIGAVDFTGDMPVILGPDGPSLGGFVCPVTVVRDELWKLGQLRPGDTVQFVRVAADVVSALPGGAADGAIASNTAETDAAASSATQTFVTAPAAALAPAAPAVITGSTAEPSEPGDCILARDASAGGGIGVVYRRSGDRNVLVEYGPLVLDLNLRFRVHALMCWLDAHRLPGMLDLTPGIRSLQVQFDPRTLPLDALLVHLQAAERELPDVTDMRVPNRIVHLPLSWDDPSTRVAIERYMQSVRPDAPWCPSNIEFIRRINGLAHIDDVKRIVFDARYLVMGLGDVYLGAPVATPIDPRHRLVTTKYNPARTWTPENAVGIGGAYLCVYGMEGPGGYQFVGRTVQMWNRHRTTREFEAGKPWLLRFFDEIRFYEVSEAELSALRADFIAGRAALKIEESVFDLRAYNGFLRDEADSIAAFKASQQAAFDAERERWRAAGHAEYVGDAEPGDAQAARVAGALDATQRAIAADVSGSVWKVLVEAGERVTEGQVVAIVESMKMEVAVTATESGTIETIDCAPGAAVVAGQRLMVMKAGAAEEVA
ncbi:urea carboxylase [Burkholderia sp. SIMBA_043]|uniref:urea carboxylase n=1 Tax=Burkholderia TaxID=32008 RepID=UPI0005D75EB4|nr:urea carboxylase [Burkholderia vietnamiensis]AJY08488.1 urea carboxylase [Burkholderia vietnamiensis LMG 10929]AVR14397.1 urea carboxylase [Burkholderia vietnamiensis]KVM52185.1 urea carboxylase [Burkholderia vietnamiensis]KVR76728.1 urea carboxylase [Burkholderia vietnamiensis]KVR98783.1 urea carboxylase [Burkholderia vietnamiensis]